MLEQPQTEDCLFANDQYYCPETAPTVSGQKGLRPRGYCRGLKDCLIPGLMCLLDLYYHIPKMYLQKDVGNSCGLYIRLSIPGEPVMAAQSWVMRV